MKRSCCELDSMCGYPLREGVLLVAASTIILSFSALCLTGLKEFLTEESTDIKRKMVYAHTMIFCLVAISLSLYQIVISSLLFWQAKYTPGKIFLCSLWYTSHVSILLVYTLLYFTRVIVYCLVQWYFWAFLCTLVAITHVGLFTYFCVVVNSFLHSLNMERFL